MYVLSLPTSKCWRLVVNLELQPKVHASLAALVISPDNNVKREKKFDLLMKLFLTSLHFRMN